MAQTRNLDLQQLTKKYNDLINKDIEDAEGIGFILVFHDFNSRANPTRIGTNFGTEDVPNSLMVASMEASVRGEEIEERTGKNPREQSSPR